MYEKILKMITVPIVLLTAATCVAMNYMPGVHEQALKTAEIEAWLESQENETETSVAEKVETVASIVEEDELGGQLRIQLPEQIEREDITIKNDYVTQTIFISFETDIEDYFSNYSISGSSDHIASLYYYNNGKNGVIALGLDKVYEIESDIVKQDLYLDFINLHDIYDKIVVVDAGHGSRASGAVKLNIEEKNIDLAIVLELKKLFEQSSENIGVYYTRTDDSNPTFKQRADLANKAEADLFISVHNNSSPSGAFSSLHGTQVLYKKSDKSELSKKFATICLNNVVEELGSKKIGLLEGDDIYIIRSSEVPVALIEVGFMTNRSELEKLSSQDYQEKAAKGIYNAILEAFEKGY